MADASKIDYQTTTFTLKADHLGSNKATLLHARTTLNNSRRSYRAILYLHGYVDYFFHDHVCQQCLEHGYDFYALDLRKCGRSIVSPDNDAYKHYCQSLQEYDEEITLAIEHMIKEANGKEKKFILLGHSTGGLIATLYARSGARHADIDALILNSPYLAPVDTTLTDSVLLNAMIKFGLSKDVDAGWYGQSIHASGRGEWNFDTSKKAIDKVRMHGAFFGAVRAAQHELSQDDFSLTCPILFMCSHRSVKPGKAWGDEYSQADLILNVKTMRRVAATIGSHITMYELENAMHDIFLSKQPVRDKAFRLMFRWLENLEDDWALTAAKP